VALAGLAAAAAAAGAAYAGGIVGEFNWDDGTLQNWTEDEAWVSLSNPGLGGIGNSGFLQVDLTADEAGNDYALVKVDADRLFAGTWQPRMHVEFDFLARDVQPRYVEVRWGSSTNENVWQARVFDAQKSSMPTQTWTHLGAPRFERFEDWDFGGGNQEQFVSDLATVDWIGVYIAGVPGQAQDYGIDDFRLMTPEPAQALFVALGAAVSVLSARRRRRRHMNPEPEPLSERTGVGFQVPGE
jgi:hypothetical protein